VPYFNAPIFLQNKTQVGKIEEIFGSITTPVRRAPPPRAPAPRLSAYCSRPAPHPTPAGRRCVPERRAEV